MEVFKPDFFECKGCEYKGNYNGLANHLRYNEEHMSEEEKREMLSEYLREIKKIEGKINSAILTEMGCVTENTYIRYFGSWNQALMEIFGEVNQKSSITREELLDELERLSKELDRAPSQVDIRDESKFSIGPYKRRFGGLNGAKDIIGMEKYERGDPVCGKRNWMYGKSEESYFYNVTGDEHPAYQHGEGSTNYYGPRWDTICQEVRERDNHECYFCSIKNTEHLERYKRSLDVHHIKAQKSFKESNGEIDYEASNRKNNLITLCKSCHGKLEGKFENCNLEEFIMKASEIVQ